MAVRLRKLAQEIGRSPAELLGLLHGLGFPRYRSSEDMVSDPVATKARLAARAGMSAEPVAPEAVRKASKPAQRQAGTDLMATLVPGVVRVGAKARPVPKARPLSAEPAAAPRGQPDQPAPKPSNPLEAVVDALSVERDALRERVAELTLALARLERELAAAARAERETAERAAAEEAVAPGSGTSLVDLLKTRGLRGRDEHARALAALARLHQLDPDALLAADPAAFAQVLSTRLVLFGGDVPEELSSIAGVAVSLDRADLPGASALRKAVERASEQLMLNGLRRLKAIGVAPHWHGLLRSGLDSRIDLQLAPGGPRDAAGAARDAAGTDVVWLWDVPGDDGAVDAWRTSELVVHGPAELHGAVLALIRALEDR